MREFTKLHGLGNDFILFDGRQASVSLSAADVRALCDRHRGVGADGVLILRPCQGVDAALEILNADGTPSGMCGNGLRCVARFLLGQHSESSAWTVRVDQVDYRCERTAADDFRVRMGIAAHQHPSLPGPPTVVDREFVAAVDETRLRGVPVWLGNPHFVVFAEHGTPQAMAERHGTALERHPAFPNRVNVSFAQPVSGGFRVVTHERGVGVTMACGSGACAVGVAAVAMGRARSGEPIAVHVPGGTLRVLVGAGGEVELEGPAVEVFRGQLGPSSPGVERGASE